MKSELEKLNNGDWYYFLDSAVVARKARAAQLCQDFNALPATDAAAQTAKIRDLFGTAGTRLSVQAHFHCDYGKNIHVGDDFLSNYNLTILDIAPVTMGNHVMIGPNVGIYTVNHPMTASGRREYKAKALPITIGNDVWLGGNVVILPGVTIGNNVVVAAGAVVNSDVPDNTLMAGVPAKPIKSLSEF
ncbi:acetyltransferase [Secundilactobacillus paracollinoides]|uniref:sugar O-acetyltransferase n=1 Tax=Secundilactobacillus paracollinoides TaxID=240427 RepID=UPI00081AA68A|nr:sugar O-acetyltransferase [Secundilactobacillus paracollinoides]ANZ63736.1 acetyltransferase [Secundilactobacillus paracollinoides]